MTPHQRLLVAFAARNNHQITKEQAVTLLGDNYFHNAEKYVGEILARMVNSGILTRLKPGIFRLEPVQKPKSTITKIPSQSSLF